MDEPLRVGIELGPQSHAVLVGDRLLERLAEWLPHDLAGAPQLLVHDAGVPERLVARARLGLGANLGAVLPVPGGEGEKSWAGAGRLLERLVASGLPREGALVALGGGATCDLCGLAAALYQRGVALVLLPTTLLAQVDAAVGGKSAVNLGGVKNAVGTIAQPRLVVADTLALASLSTAELWSGLGEVAKYALLSPGAVWPLIDGKLPALAGGAWTGDWPALVHACVQVKARVVEAEPGDGPARAALNLGHTLGHALEAAATGRLPHGLAVVYGLRAALRLSFRLGWLTQGELDRGQALLAPFPGALPPLDRESVRRALSYDKKRTASGPRFVLLHALGQPELVADLPERWIDDEIDRTLGGA